ncbi:HD domain-containing protein [Acinetobacter nectaris]|uniref:HD domain-containing protein n=1 Tax=Acinetobacter nectaris CIP 110549 TaxID=1392540 RepID=V2TPS3_9GAMM|nr:HD domain-containing protein [Acinetobacter nectaris]ESK40031.1 hypothetical protein P256_00470 [Acinetobacter nectaris CIP 110549]MCF9035406.1 HD domain-containing protein [Acinetobacter nectaris]
MANLEKAIALATKKHAGQTDKAGQAYILHPLRIMLKMKNDDQRIVAVLHDVLEDTDTTVVDLISIGFAPHIIDAVIALTKKNNESRIEAAFRAVKNSIAREVKLADIADNMDLTRIKNPTVRDKKRLQEYQEVQEILLAGA